MKFLSRLSVLIILLLSSFSLAGEIPIQVGPNKDSGPTIAYNSVDDEYLVVWTETSATISSEIIGQRIKADGTGNIGSAFTIFSIGAYPSVAYNSQTNEYIVTESLLGNIIGRRVSNVGTLIGSPVTYMSKNISIWSKIIYNSLGNNYLLVAAELFDLGNDQSSIKISTRKITSDGQLTGTENLIREQGHGNYSDGARFSVAYAPIISTTTPSGRYLLAIKDPTDLTMLDDNGVIVSKVYDPQQPGLVVDDHVPFQASKVGIPYNVDVAFGNWEGQEAFMVVWGDRDQTVNNQQWTGIWAGIVDAAPVEYKSGSVNTTVFPVSAIPNHNITPEYSKTWKPAVTYNKISYKFMVAWRETPTTDPLNDTKVNHIRANSVATAITPVNVVLSSTTGNENPKNPAIAASTKNSNALVVWEDSRNLATTDVDLYGNILNTTPAKVLIVTSPNGSEVWQAGTQQKIVWESSDVGDFDVTIEYSIDNGATYNFIAFQTNIDGVNTFDWTVPNSPSTQCLVKISASVFSDTSDNFFTITPQETPKITVISPNGGEIWEVGSQQEIKWDLSNEIDSVFIDINYFGIGSLKVNSIEKTLNDGSFIWTVTDWWSTDSVDCRISVSYSIGNNYYRDESDTFFTIIKSKPKITVISPNGGENWIDNEQHEIKWTSTGFSGNVRIDLLYHGTNDTGYFNIALNELNDGTFNWNLDISKLPIQSNPQGFNCLIRVSDATKNPPGVGPDDGKIFDWSNTYFTFKPKTPKITVVSPNGGEIWTVGEQREIKWTSENFTDSVNIVLTTFYQVSISGVIAQNVPNTGSYFWTVKTGITDTVKALIRVEEAKIMATILDESDAFFTIIDTTAKIIYYSNRQ